MDTIEKLIKSLEEAKAELQKNMNCTPGSTGMNKEDTLKADQIVPDTGYGKITIKDTSPKPTNPAKPFGSVIMKDEDMEKDSADPKLAPKEVKVKQLQAQIDAGTYKPDSAKIAGAMLKEEMTCHANGQWNLKTTDDGPEMASPKHSK